MKRHASGQCRLARIGSSTVFLRNILKGMVALACAGSAALAFAAQAETISAPEAYASQGGVQPTRHVPIRRRAFPFARRFALDPVDSVRVQGIQARLREGKAIGRPRQIGFGRDVPGLSSQSAARKQLIWQTQPDGGQAASVSVASAGAEGIRLGVRVYKLPPEALLRVHAPDDEAAVQFSGQEILDRIAGKLAAGDDSEDAHIWRAPTVEAEEAALDIILPPGVPTSAVEIAVPDISHLFASARTDWKAAGKFSLQGAQATAALSCHADVTCQSEWDPASKATALMLYTEKGNTYICTGTLLNAKGSAATRIPYFLTANHCISSQTAADTLETRWFYRSATCNGSQSAQVQSLQGGATLLYASAVTDIAFLRLKEQPPAGVAYAGWQASTPVIGATAGGIHHPGGDRQKLALGSVSDWVNIVDMTGDGNFDLSRGTSQAASHLKITWREGATEGGSSGSGLFDKDSKRLIGVLTGGPDASSCRGGFGVYGRFERAFSAKLREYLDPASVATPAPVATPVVAAPAARFSLSVQRSGNGTVTGSGINCGSDCTEQYASGARVTLTAAPASGQVFAGWRGACSGTSRTCTVAMDADRSVAATFQSAAKVAGAVLSVQRSSIGVVVGQGINCGFRGVDCTEQYAPGAQVTLTAFPAVSGYRFAGWRGACSGTSPTCRLSMNASADVSPVFSRRW